MSAEKIRQAKLLRAKALRDAAKAKSQPSVGGQVLDAINQGLFLGFGDELQAGLGAAYDAVTGNAGLSDAYDARLAAERASLKDFEADNPLLAPVIEGIAGVGPALATVPLAPLAAPTLAGRVLAGATTGGVMSGAHGLGTGEGGAGPRLESAKEQGTIGAVLGGGLPVAGKAVSKLSESLAPLLGVSTGAYSPAIREAYRTGKTDPLSSYKRTQPAPAEAEAFRRGMRDPESTFEPAQEEAQRAVRSLRAIRGQNYRAGLDKLDETQPLPFDRIGNAVDEAMQVQRYKGLSLDPATDAAQQEMLDIVGRWATLPPGTYHTPKGLDGLRRAVRNLAERHQPNTPEHRVGSRVARAISDEIEDASPGYKELNRQYGRDSARIAELERELGAGGRTQTAGTLRKLQSIMRDNASTAHGRRGQLAEGVREQAPTLMPMVAGQQMASMTPRGLMGPMSGMMAGAGAATVNPAMLSLLPLTSPRLVGEAAHLAGRVSTSRANTALDRIRRLLARAAVPQVAEEF